MSAVRDIITAALARSAKNRPTTANVENELRLVVGRLVQQYVGAGVEVNPVFFGAITDIAGVGGLWARPENTEAVFRIETVAGVEVVVVPIDERTVDHGKPRLYRMGEAYLTVGGVGDPAAADSLRFFVAQRAILPATVDEGVDPRWPSAFDTLLVIETALYLAVKDGRPEEVAGLTTERDAWVQVYTQFLRHETMNEVRQFHPHRFSEIAEKPLGGGTPT